MGGEEWDAHRAWRDGGPAVNRASTRVDAESEDARTETMSSVSAYFAAPVVDVYAAPRTTARADRRTPREDGYSNRVGRHDDRAPRSTPTDGRVEARCVVYNPAALRVSEMSDGGSNDGRRSADGGGHHVLGFPAARGVLWDATPVGEGILVGAHHHAPTLRLAPGVSRALASVAREASASDDDGPDETETETETETSSRPTRAVVTLSGTFASFDVEHDPRGGSSRVDGVVVSTSSITVDAVHVGGIGAEADGATAASSRVAIEAAVEQTRDGLRADGGTVYARDAWDADVFAARCSRRAKLRPAAMWPMRAAVALERSIGPDGSCRDDDVALRVTATLALPSEMFRATPIVPLRAASTSALHRDLIARQAHQARSADPIPLDEVESGFLTMDRARRLVPLFETEPRAFDLPIVGVWVSGAANVAHLSVWAACLRFAAHTQLKDKVVQSGSFLLALYQPGGRAGPAVYDVAAVEKSESASPAARYAASMRCAPGEGASATFRAVSEMPRAGAEATGEKAGEGWRKGRVGAGDGGRGGEASGVDASLSFTRESGRAAAAAARPKPPDPDPDRSRGHFGRIWSSGSSHRGLVGDDPAVFAWSPLRVPPTAYEAAASSAAAARAAFASVRSGRPRTEMFDADDETEMAALTGSARRIVLEQQRQITALRTQVEALRAEIASVAVDAEEDADVEERASRQYPGVGAGGFGRFAGGGYDAPAGVAWGGDCVVSTGELRVGGVTSGGGRREEEGTAEEDREGGEGGDRPLRSPKSPLNKALAFSRAQAAEARLSKKRKEKRKDEEEEEEETAQPRQRNAAAEASDEGEVDDTPDDGAPTAAGAEVSVRDLVARAESVALRHKAAAAAVVAEERAARRLPPPPTAIPPRAEPGPFPPQPLRVPQPPRLPYVDHQDDIDETGERAVDPVFGADEDSDAYVPHFPRTAFNETGVGLHAQEAAEDDETLLSSAALMADPTTMDAETAAAAAAAARREMVRLAGSPRLSGGGAPRDELVRAAVRTGMDHMYPTIDFEADQEELSADEDEEILARYVERFGGHRSLMFEATGKTARYLNEEEEEEEDA